MYTDEIRIDYWKASKQLDHLFRFYIELEEIVDETRLSHFSHHHILLPRMRCFSFTARRLAALHKENITTSNRNRRPSQLNKPWLIILPHCDDLITRRGALCGILNESIRTALIYRGYLPVHLSLERGNLHGSSWGNWIRIQFQKIMLLSLGTSKSNSGSFINKYTLKIVNLFKEVSKNNIPSKLYVWCHTIIVCWIIFTPKCSDPLDH